MRVRRLTLALASLLSSGCYSYTPMLATQQDAGIDVRLRLTDAGSVAMAPTIGPQMEIVMGRLLSASDSSYALALTQTEDRRGIEQSWRGERVVFPRTAVAGVERRKLSQARSWAVGGIVVGAVALVGAVADLGGSSGSRVGTPGSAK
jgi:hypothetical protein